MRMPAYVVLSTFLASMGASVRSIMFLHMIK